MANINYVEGKSLQIVLEIPFKNPSYFPFRLIGDKANGVFVTCITDERSFLKNGDIFLYCENIKLSGLSCNQVYSVIKYFSLKNDGTINILIWRNSSKYFENRMKRHWTVNEGLNLVNTQFIAKQSHNHYHENEGEEGKEEEDDEGEEKGMLLMEDKNINNERNNNNNDSDKMLIDNNVFLYHQSNFNNNINDVMEDGTKSSEGIFDEKQQQLKIHSYVVVFDEAKCKTTTLIQSKKKYFSDIFNKAYSQNTRFWMCPKCKYHVRSRRLHTIKHDWISSARRLLPHSASNFFELQRFNDKEDDEEVDGDEDDNISSYEEYSSLL
uniref:C2H2-type domain-containing protein n=1 Tax=Strongyloides papillosus TaxID=174720 RepID=A0A0N5BCU6_STREA